ncbi:MAG: M56 family metallopeptidase [Pirellulales bacterium]
MPDALYLVGWNQFVAILMGTAVWLACRTRMLSRRPAVCHGLWLLVLLKFVTPPIVPVPVLPAIPAEVQSSAAVLPSTVRSVGCESGGLSPFEVDSETIANQAGKIGIYSCPPAVVNTTVSPPQTDFLREARSLTWRGTCIALLEVSLFVTCVLWIAAACQFVHVRRLLRGSAVESGRVAELLREVSRRFNLTNSVTLQIVDAPITPMLWAMPGNPAIVLPRELVNSLSDDGLRSILAHELAHFIRRDHWANCLALFVTTLWWWNPLVWFARRQLSAAAETCCDAAALERLRGSRKSYAETLLTVVDSLTTTTPLRSAMGIAFGESHSLRRRFELIADANVKARMTPRGWLLLAVGLGTLTLIPARAQENSAPSIKVVGAQATAENHDAPAPATTLSEPWGPDVGGLRCRLVGVPTDVNDEFPDPTKTTSNFARSDDVTFAVELQNVGDKPATLLGVRYGDSYGSAKGKLATASLAPHLFEFEFTAKDGNPVSRPSRMYLESILHLSGASAHEIEPGKSLIVLLRPTKFASPMDYQFTPGTFRATVRYRGPTEKVLAKIRKHWPDKPQMKAWSGEVASNQVAFTVADDPNASKPADLQWGEPKDGMRAAVEFRPRYTDQSVADPREPVPRNTALNVVVHLQNVSEQPIALVSETWRQDDGLTVIDEADKETELRGTRYSGWPVMVRWTLKPGEVAEIHSAAIGVVADKAAAEQLEHPIGKLLIAKPGRYLLRYTIRLGSIQVNDDKGNIVVPAITDWQGQLVTGETPLEVE